MVGKDAYEEMLHIVSIIPTRYGNIHDALDTDLNERGFIEKVN